MHRTRLVDTGVALGAAVFVLAVTWPALGPSSVWIDDAWVALAAKADSPAQLGQTMITAHGFTAINALWLRLAGVHGVAVQALPLLFGMAAPGAAWIALRRWARWTTPAALLATVLVATSPLVLTFATRVKQYTLDVVLAALLSAAALALARRPEDGRGRWWLTAGGIGSIIFSAATASVAGAAVLVAFVAAAAHAAGGWRSVRWPHLRSVGGPLAVFVGVALLWAGLVLRTTIPEGMYTFWRNQFLPVDEGAGAVVDAVGTGFVDVVEAVLGLPASVALPLAALGVVTGIVRRHLALVGMVALPVAASLMLSALQRAPWGGGRTESHLVLAFALAVAALALPARGEDEATGEERPSRRRPGSVLAVVLVGAVALVAAAGLERPSYPREDLRPLLADLEDGIADDEVILVYPFARLAYALYTPSDVTFKPNPGSSVGYALDIEDPRVRLLPAWRRDVTMYPPIVADLTDGACGVWLPASHSFPDDLGAIEASLADLGYDRIRDWTAEGASLSHWRRCP